VKSIVLLAKDLYRWCNTASRILYATLKDIHLTALSDKLDGFAVDPYFW